MDKTVEKRLATFNFEPLLRTVIALIVAMIFGGLIIIISGYNPFEVYALIFSGAFADRNSVLNTLTHSIPLLFSGLAYLFAIKGNLLNLGVEGQIIIGSMVASIVGVYFSGLPRFIHLPLTLILGSIAGGLLATIAAVLQTKFGANLFITTMMLNYVINLFCGYLVTGLLNDGSGLPQTSMILETAKLARIYDKHMISTSVFIVSIITIIVTLLINRTRFGYQLRVVGDNPTAAKTAGINTNKITMLSMLISGSIAGLCGSTLISGTYYRFIDNNTPGFGFMGISVATMGGQNPLLTPIAAVFWGAIKAGTLKVNRVANLPMDIILLIQSIVIILITAPQLLEKIIKPIKKMMHLNRAK